MVLRLTVKGRQIVDPNHTGLIVAAQSSGYNGSGFLQGKERFLILPNEHEWLKKEFGKKFLYQDVRSGQQIFETVEVDKTSLEVNEEDLFNLIVALQAEVNHLNAVLSLVDEKEEVSV